MGWFSSEKIQNSQVSTLVVLRHGEDHGDNLTVVGRSHIEGLALNLIQFLGQEILSPGQAVIAHSKAKKSYETAVILEEKIGIHRIGSFASLGDERGLDYFGNEKLLLNEFTNIARAYPVLLLVTHEPHTEYVAKIIHPKINNNQNRIINKGWARVYDSKGKSTTISHDYIS